MQIKNPWRIRGQASPDNKGVTGGGSPEILKTAPLPHWGLRGYAHNDTEDTQETDKTSQDERHTRDKRQTRQETDKRQTIQDETSDRQDKRQTRKETGKRKTRQNNKKG